jgi:hypothetical protein
MRRMEYLARVDSAIASTMVGGGARGCPCQGTTYFSLPSRMISTAIEPRPLHHEGPQGRSDNSMCFVRVVGYNFSR